MSSVPEGRAANHPSADVTLRPPIGAPFPGAVGYITGKAAVLAFANTVAVEYRKQKVRCNTILPSVIDTPANRAAQPDADHTRWVSPTAIADVITYLASDASAATSGATIPVYGRA